MFLFEPVGEQPLREEIHGQQRQLKKEEMPGTGNGPAPVIQAKEAAKGGRTTLRDVAIDGLQ
eukprot:CAMPEP_0171414110 /NCGR_PEP_ID=MMETSP0880-20121228/36593_1 /TAXON_ID=67004 /ORGANISM="Thalassiosira weissflogii, Strain CCMP1336" /LENGTH=61 /DNA_ID=CAMNT_0011931957 /DNA_START=315 /DNA_END=503 /DNA_ORIENTATION=-